MNRVHFEQHLKDIQAEHSDGLVSDTKTHDAESRELSQRHSAEIEEIRDELRRLEQVLEVITRPCSVLTTI